MCILMAARLHFTAHGTRAAAQKKTRKKTMWTLQTEGIVNQCGYSASVICQVKSDGPRPFW